MVLPLENRTKSYWVEAADSPLRNFRSTPELPVETDVLIIGSGYTGAAFAYWLHKYTESHGTTPRVLMLEARDVCGSATGRNGGHLRPYKYPAYSDDKARFGQEGALSLLRFENAHLELFQQLLADEGIADEVAFELCETFDAAMSDEALELLVKSFDAMRADLGADGEIIKECRMITDPKEAEEVTQMRGTLAAGVYPAAKIWPYKFVHALLNIVLKTGKLNLQANTQVNEVSARDAAGWITAQTSRGPVRAKTVLHATNRWVPHLLPEFANLIFPSRTVMAAIDNLAPRLKLSGTQFWDSRVLNYHIQLPPPHNVIISGGGRLATAHKPRSHQLVSDEEDKLFEKASEYYQHWAASNIVGWPEESPVQFARVTEDGGLWSGVMSFSIDGLPYVGAVPDRPGQFISAGYGGHGMPRILLSTAHVVPAVLDLLGVAYTAPPAVLASPPLPEPYKVTRERVEALQKIDTDAKFKGYEADSIESSKKPFCVDIRERLGLQA